MRALLEGRPVANQYGGGGGRWYVKFIRMERVTGDTIDYRSRWATLTSELR